MNRKLRNGAIAVVIVLILVLILWWILSGKSESAEGSDPASALTVQVVAPREQTWPQTLAASGPIAAWQEAIVSPETGGLRISGLLVDVGAKVKRGQVLARLADDSVRMDLRKQRAAVAQASASLQQATSDLKRAHAVESSGALSAQQLEEYSVAETKARATLASAEAELDSIQLRLDQTRIVAPDDGYVSSKSAVLGNVVNAGAELFRLVRKSQVEWRPELDARQLSLVRIGQAADVVLPSGAKVRGKVREIGPTLSENTGRATVYVSLPPDGAAKPGMFANGALILDAKPALTLPESAVVLRDGRAYVFIVDAQDKVSSHAVDTGRRQDDRIEILTSIDRKARIVTSGGAFLSENAHVTVVSGAKATPGATP